MAKGAYIGVENFTPRTLPSGFTQVEYLESSGTQYIDTGFKHNQNTRICIDIKNAQSKTTTCAFGGRISNTSATIGVFTGQITMHGGPTTTEMVNGIVFHL